MVSELAVTIILFMQPFAQIVYNKQSYDLLILTVVTYTLTSRSDLCSELL